MSNDPDSTAAPVPADDAHYWSTGDAAAAIRAGRISSRDHLELLLDRVERLNPPLNAVVTLDAERARREADAADRALAEGRDLGPLHGVAMTIKDSFQTIGMRTTSGAPELSGHIPEVDAVPVARLRAAGAVVFGKTNLPIYAGDTQSYNAVFGQTNNPWNLERTPGGSSGGSAAALAAGFTPLELGSDIGGSIRGPASTCGIFGHKPSYGIVPALGQIPGPPGTLTQADIAVAGPMAAHRGRSGPRPRHSGGARRVARPGLSLGANVAAAREPRRLPGRGVVRGTLLSDRRCRARAARSGGRRP